MVFNPAVIPTYWGNASQQDGIAEARRGGSETTPTELNLI